LKTQHGEEKMVTVRELMNALLELDGNPDWDIDCDVMISVQGDIYALKDVSEAGSSPLFPLLSAGERLS
jgi:hypothetical protein